MYRFVLFFFVMVPQSNLPATSYIWQPYEFNLVGNTIVGVIEIKERAEILPVKPSDYRCGFVYHVRVKKAIKGEPGDYQIFRMSDDGYIGNDYLYLAYIFHRNPNLSGLDSNLRKATPIPTFPYRPNCQENSYDLLIPTVPQYLLPIYTDPESSDCAKCQWALADRFSAATSDIFRNKSVTLDGKTYDAFLLSDIISVSNAILNDQKGSK